MPQLELRNDDLIAVIAALVADELASQRHIPVHDLLPESWRSDTLIRRPGQGQAFDIRPDTLQLEASSLELVAAATRVSLFFRLYSIGVEDYLLRLPSLGEWAELVTEARLQGAEGFCFSSSGSTGEPRRHEHPEHALHNEVAVFANLIPSHSGVALRRVLAPLPCHHIYGFLFSVLLPAQLQLPVLRGSAARRAIQSDLRSGDLIVGFPFFWQQLLRFDPRFAPGVTGLTSTAPCPAETIGQLQTRGLETLIEIHGSSETGGIGWRSAPRQPFTLLPRWQPAATDLSEPGLIEVGLIEVDSGRAIDSPDQLDWTSPRQYHPRGRVDGAVQVGGVNVYPAQVAAQLQQLGWIADAAVRPMTDTNGTRLKAFVVPAAAPTWTRQQERAWEQDLRDWCARNLSDPEHLAHIRFGPALPVNPLGKHCDWPTTAQPSDSLTEMTP